MRIAKIFLISLAVLTALPAAAQHYDPDHAHAIEISSGYPSIAALLRPLPSSASATASRLIPATTT